MPATRCGTNSAARCVIDQAPAAILRPARRSRSRGEVNGKLRGRVTVPANAGEAAVREAALADAGVQRYIDGKAVRKFIYVPGKLANVVV
jgi:leucyl-tRNA synthetase